MSRRGFSLRYLCCSFLMGGVVGLVPASSSNAGDDQAQGGDPPQANETDSAGGEGLDPDISLAPDSGSDSGAQTGLGAGQPVDGDIDLDADADLGDEEGATVAGERLEGAAALERALGRDAYLRSLSAENLQQALDQLLDNRRERIKSYYRMRELRDIRVEEERDRITAAEAEELAEQKAPERLSQKHFYDKTGKLFWPDPLGSKVLEPYTSPINNKFQKRANAPEDYSAQDADVVQRLVRLIQDAIDTLKDDMAPEDYARAQQYLDRVAYEARFNAKGKRVDIQSAQSSGGTAPSGAGAEGQDGPSRSRNSSGQSQGDSGASPEPPPEPEPKPKPKGGQGN